MGISGLRRRASKGETSREEDADLLAGATIETHDLSGIAPSTRAVSAGAGDTSRLGLTGEWQRLRLYGGGLLLALCFGLFGWQAWRGRNPVPISVQPAPVGSMGGADISHIAGATGAAGTTDEIRVHVAGAVTQPGVYRLTQGERVQDAIRAAGGLAPDADSARVNLAQRVRDGQRVDVPFARQSGVAVRAAEQPAERTTAQPAGGKLNVNTATPAQLERLPGIGEVSAAKIIAYRQANGPIRSLDQLRQAGVSDTLLRRAADYLVFE